MTFEDFWGQLIDEKLDIEGECSTYQGIRDFSKKIWNAGFEASQMELEDLENRNMEATDLLLKARCKYKELTEDYYWEISKYHKLRERLQERLWKLRFRRSRK